MCQTQRLHHPSSSAEFCTVFGSSVSWLTEHESGTMGWMSRLSHTWSSTGCPFNYLEFGTVSCLTKVCIPFLTSAESDWYWQITWRDLQKIKAYLTAQCFKPSSNLFFCGTESSVTRLFLHRPPTSLSFLLHFFSCLHPLFFYPSLPHLMTRTSHGMAFHVTRQQAENKRRGALNVFLNSMCFSSPLFLFHSPHFFPSLLSLPFVSHRKRLALHIVVTLETVVFAV